MAGAAVDFYQVLTGTSFTLLGLWFTVLGLGPRNWREDVDAHRRTGHVALHFFLPGLMGLVSVLAGGTGLVWRVAFVLGGVIGVVESIALLASRRRFRGRLSVSLMILDPVVYLLVAAAAVLPVPLGGLLPVQVEGIVTGALFAIGLLYLWASFSAGLVPADTAED